MTDTMLREPVRVMSPAGECSGGQGADAEVESLLENWRDLLAEHALKTRHILRKLLTKRIRFVPEARDGVRGHLLEAEGTVRPLLAAVAAPEGTADAYEKKGVASRSTSRRCDDAETGVALGNSHGK